MAEIERENIRESTLEGLDTAAGKRKGQNPSVASIYRALAEHAKREAYPEAVEQAHADFADLRRRPPGPDRTPRRSAHDHDRSHRDFLHRNYSHPLSGTANRCLVALSTTLAGQSKPVTTQL
jgi:DNA invertase Pin-like site-specific DNA recombinase